MSQSGSLSSGSSQYSSGYYSDSSNSESITSKSSRPAHPKVAYKHMGGQDHNKIHDNCTLKEQLVISSSSSQTTSPQIHDDESSCLTNSRQAGLENGSLQKKSASPYGSNNDTAHSSLPKYSYPLQSSSTKTSMIPKPSSGRPITSHCTSSGYHSSHKMRLSSVQDSTLQSSMWLVIS